jgi:DNA-binding GntR family transcriptional regulator
MPLSPATTFKTKEEYVADVLREGILAGRFPRGARFKQAEIAQMLNISITPVREAFRILEAEGYVLSITHRGVVVAPFDASTTREIMELRVTLESQLAAAAMQNMTPRDEAELAKLERDFEKAIARGNRPSVRAMNYRFHSHLYSLAQRPQTLHFVQVLWAKYPFDLINLIPDRPARAAKEHAAILKAIARRDQKALLSAVREHIEAGWSELDRKIDAHPELPNSSQKTAA